MDIDHEILKFSNMNRDIHIGHLLETDKEGTGLLLIASPIEARRYRSNYQK